MQSLLDHVQELVIEAVINGIWFNRELYWDPETILREKSADDSMAISVGSNKTKDTVLLLVIAGIYRFYECWAMDDVIEPSEVEERTYETISYLFYLLNTGPGPCQGLKPATQTEHFSRDPARSV
jgi:hypothetical protein